MHCWLVCSLICFCHSFLGSLVVLAIFYQPLGEGKRVLCGHILQRLDPDILAGACVHCPSPRFLSSFAFLAQ